MKRIAKITVALLLAVAMCFSLAGCYDEDLNWSAKYDDTELPAGAYIYYLSIAYNEAASKVSTEDEVLKSEIDGTPGRDVDQKPRGRVCEPVFLYSERNEASGP